MTFPIILAHGVCRFDILWNESLDADNNDDPKIDRLNYFRGIRTMLKDKGYTVYHSKVAWAANVDKQIGLIINKMSGFSLRALRLGVR
jgi:hypothetical protein